MTTPQFSMRHVTPKASLSSPLSQAPTCPARYLLPVVGGVGKHRGDVEHDLVALVGRVEGVGARGVGCERSNREDSTGWLGPSEGRYGASSVSHPTSPQASLGKDLLLVSSCAAYLRKPLRQTFSPSRAKNSSKAGPASSLLYISSSELWPALQYRTPTLCFRQSWGEGRKSPLRASWGPRLRVRVPSDSWEGGSGKEQGLPEPQARWMGR